MLIIKELILKILNAFLGVTRRSISYQIANTVQISNIAGSAAAVILPDGYYVVFFSMGFKTTTTRGTASAVFRFVSPDGYVMETVNPYFYPSVTSGVYGYSYGNSDGYWMGTNREWTANTEYRCTGVGLMRETSTHI